MKVCICTTPVRPIQTNYPPFGSMAIIEAIREAGQKASFYNIDYFRYSHKQIEAHFREQQFDVVGISAVVSTAYAYTKYLSALIHEVSPQTIVIVGGNLAASAEILLRKCNVKICVTGDGELIVKELLPVLNERPLNLNSLKSIKGICFLDERGEFCFTGYGAKPSADAIRWPDYGILEEDGSLPYFISDKIEERVYGYEGAIEPGKRIASIVMSKGCVARCTFCHRFEKGYRPRSVEQVMEHVEFLIDRYNVGVLNISDENFGSDREIAWEIASHLGKLGIVWSVGGVRTSTVSKESLQHWKDNGCYMVLFGVETGSAKMLAVMEKNLTLEKNVNALKWTGEAGLGTVIQLVLGMPGEDDKTIGETIEFLKAISPSMKWWKGKPASELISVNYAQALPGTPLYEFARQHHLIGQGIDEEEQYLINISDVDAYKEDHFVNTTGLPLLKVLMWRPILLANLDAYHCSIELGGSGKISLAQVAWYYLALIAVRVGRTLKRRLSLIVKGPEKALTGKAIGGGVDYITKSGYFNIHSGLKYAPLLLNQLTKHIFYPLLAVIVVARVSNSPWHALKLLFEHLSWSLSSASRVEAASGKSLRKTISILPSTRARDREDKMLPLRMGR